jgi:hypothetical protein
VLGNGARPPFGLFVHGQRASRARRPPRWPRGASGRSREMLATYASGSRRDAAEVVAHLASRVIARFVCSRLPSGLPSAFADTRSRAARLTCSVTVLAQLPATPCMASERHVLAGFPDGDAERPAGPRGDARDVRVRFAPRRSRGRGARRVSVN